VALAAAPLAARDAFVLFSGGGTPLTNNYSQYLQARELTKFLQARYPQEQVWIFFGAGNREGVAPIFSDVRRQTKQDGLILESWLPGVLPRNRPGNKREFLDALRTEVLPVVREGGTLYLFVGDHGTQQKDGKRESLITLWQMKPSGPGGGWRTDPTEELSVTELQETLVAGLGRGRVVFCMTQCHSGGFHFLGLPREIAPAQEWFVGAVPEWVGSIETPPPLPRVAGFTATDEGSLAAGCDPDPDPDRWAGYERYIPEALLGTDLFTGKPVRSPAPSFAAAHESSVLVDQTIDKPRSTSEQYLERWAVLVERLVAERDLLRPDIRGAVDRFVTAIDRGLATGDGELLKARRAQFENFIQRMTEQNKSATDLLLRGNRAALERAMGPVANRPGTPGRSTRAAPPLATEWKEVVRPGWKAAVEAGTVPGLEGPALVFEKYLLAQEERGRDVMFPRNWQNPMLNDIFWQSGSAIPARHDPVRAEAVARWGAERRAKIAAWASASADEKVRAVGAKLRPPVMSFGGPRTLRTATAADRTLFYRRTLAAWAFLEQLGHRAALAEVEELTRLETTRLP
jgi:hypothetical protein